MKDKLDGRPKSGRFLRINEVVARVGLSKSSIYEMVKRGEFPAPVRIKVRAVGWWESDIDEWMSSRPPAPDTQWR